MIKLEKDSETFGDETANYNVETTYNTIGEFINGVLTNRKEEWGTISVEKHGSCEYKYGKLKTTMSEEVLKKPIAHITANGGWSLMSYKIITRY